MKTIVFILLITFVSCKTPPIETEQKGEFVLELLFEHEGCSVYRFEDRNTCIYWSDCTGKTSWDVVHHSGKTSHTEHKQTITDN